MKLEIVGPADIFTAGTHLNLKHSVVTIKCFTFKAQEWNIVDQIDLRVIKSFIRMNTILQKQQKLS
jgi:hypothetical protein